MFLFQKITLQFCQVQPFKVITMLAKWLCIHLESLPPLHLQANLIHILFIQAQFFIHQFFFFHFLFHCIELHTPVQWSRESGYCLWYGRLYLITTILIEGFTLCKFQTTVLQCIGCFESFWWTTHWWKTIRKKKKNLESPVSHHG